MEKKNYLFKFSVVTPVYNVEDYLEETIESVINQTIGFKDNIQMILVNDGSPDNSEEICLKYKEMYPDNIVYVKQENAGVSAARNHGVEYVQGKYVNFLDSDDKWELDAFEKVYDFFEQNSKKIDVVSVRAKFFEASDSFHVLDYKFKKTDVVNLDVKYDHVQLNVSMSIIKTEAIKNRRFLEGLKYGEDAQFLNRILMDKRRIGYMADTIYYYRKRANDSSAIQMELKSPAYYWDSPIRFHRTLIEESIERYGKVLPFIQYVVMYDLQWRIRKKPSQLLEYLSEEELQKYKEIICETLKYIDDLVILRQRIIPKNLKTYVLSLKYEYDIRQNLICDNFKLYHNNVCLFDMFEDKNMIQLHILEIRNEKIYLAGKIDTWLNEEDYKVVVENGKKKYKLSIYDAPQFDTYSINGIAAKGRIFETEIPLSDEGMNIKFSIWYKDIYRKKMDFSLRRFSHLNHLENSYYSCDGYLIQKKEKELVCVKCDGKLIKEKEKLYQQELLEYANTKDKLDLDEVKKLIEYRKMYFRKKKFQRKKIWLLSDRFIKAGDNAEHLFKYIMKNKSSEIEPYFVLSEGSEDYERIKKIGKVISYGSKEYMLKFLLSDKIISSNATDAEMNAFNNYQVYMRDLYQFDYIFLQHGIIKDDLSNWLNKINKNLKIFVTAGKEEYKSIINGNYAYDENVVKLTGLPRYDCLKEESEKKKKEKYILFMPTWRKKLEGKVDPDTGENLYNPAFCESDFFKFYNRLINDERLLACMRKHGYKGKLCLHPLMAVQYEDFAENDCIQVNGEYINYQEEFVKGSLLITDYSSTFFDFAYLKKPVIYAQFDEEEFFSGEHTYTKGYFDYRTAGFGPVCTDYDSTVEEIINAIDRGCVLEDQYLSRIEDFYAYTDQNNCKRVYEEIKNLR